VKTLFDIERSLERKFQSLVRTGGLEPILGRTWPIRVTLQRVSPSGKPRKARSDASAGYWGDEPWIDGEFQLMISAGDRDIAADDEDASAQAPRKKETANSGNGSLVLDRLISVLDEAESRRDFVALKWFRDVPLRQAMPLAVDGERQKLMKLAIDQNLVKTHHVDNPARPEYPVTAIRLNRSHPEVRRVLRNSSAFSNRSTNRFSPVAIRGASLSGTVLQDRR